MKTKTIFISFLFLFLVIGAIGFSDDVLNQGSLITSQTYTNHDIQPNRCFYRNGQMYCNILYEANGNKYLRMIEWYGVGNTANEQYDFSTSDIWTKAGALLKNRFYFAQDDSVKICYVNVDSNSWTCNQKESVWSAPFDAKYYEDSNYEYALMGAMVSSGSTHRADFFVEKYDKSSYAYSIDVYQENTDEQFPHLAYTRGFNGNIYWAYQKNDNTIEVRGISDSYLSDITAMSSTSERYEMAYDSNSNHMYLIEVDYSNNHVFGYRLSDTGSVTNLFDHTFGDIQNMFGGDNIYFVMPYYNPRNNELGITFSIDNGTDIIWYKYLFDYVDEDLQNYIRLGYIDSNKHVYLGDTGDYLDFSGVPLDKKYISIFDSYDYNNTAGTFLTIGIYGTSDNDNAKRLAIVYEPYFYGNAPRNSQLTISDIDEVRNNTLNEVWANYTATNGTPIALIKPYDTECYVHYGTHDFTMIWDNDTQRYVQVLNTSSDFGNTYTINCSTDDNSYQEQTATDTFTFSETAQDLCANVQCNSYCDGTTYYYDGHCISNTGNCAYNVEYNSQQCQQDLCANVQCNSYCDGTTYYYNGHCVQSTGQCSYSVAYNSPYCSNNNGGGSGTTIQYSTTCGDGVCGLTETCENCPQDCGSCSVVVNGEGIDTNSVSRATGFVTTAILEPFINNFWLKILFFFIILFSAILFVYMLRKMANMLG